MSGSVARWPRWVYKLAEPSEFQLPDGLEGWEGWEGFSRDYMVMRARTEFRIGPVEVLVPIHRDLVSDRKLTRQGWRETQRLIREALQLARTERMDRG